MMNNSKNSILLVDPEFDPRTAPDCHLLLKIAADSFSYAIIDRHSRQLKAVFDQQACEDPLQELAAAIKNDSYLQLDYAGSKVSAYTPNTIAVPDALYDAQDLNHYARFFSGEVSDTLYIRKAASSGFTRVFSLDQATSALLSGYFSKSSCFEQHAPVLALGKPENGKVLLLDFTAGSFNALVMDEGKVIFQNSFLIDNPEEFNYYLLLLIQQLELDVAAVQVLLSGIVHEHDGYYTCLNKYFHTICFNPPPAGDIDQAILEDMPAHYYSSLLALDLCV